MKEYFKGRYRNKFHLMPPVGWLNDPNGLCEYKGRYHVFFQYCPMEVMGGSTCWGHYVSKDFVNWQYLGVAVKDGEKWDKNGAYSGSALVEDKLKIFYTGNVKKSGDYDYILVGREANVVYTESKDGINFSEKRLLLSNKDYPDYYSCHVRDPKVWKKDSCYYMALGGRKKSDEGAILLYESKNKFDWHILREIVPNNEFGYMWECPDIFEIEGRYVIMCSPQGLKSEEFRFMNKYQSGYFVEDNFKLEKGEYTCNTEGFRELDMGFDFYAPQTFADSRGRRILIGWAGMPDAEYSNTPTINEGWQNSLTLPRELKLINGVLYQYPVEEINSLRYNKRKLGDNNIIEGNFDIVAETKNEFEIRINMDLIFECKDNVVTLKFVNDTGCGRGIRRCKIENGVNSVRILKDTSLLEIYVNRGQAVFTTMYYAENVERTVVSKKGVSGEIYSVKGMEVKVNE